MLEWVSYVNSLGSQILICGDFEFTCLYAFTALSHMIFSQIHIAKTWEEVKYICWNNAIYCCVIDLLMGESAGALHDITKEKLDEIKLEEAAITDKLTGVYNRHYLYERLQELLDKHRRDDSGFAIAVFDLDYFKAINDTHGHIAGDRVLQHFAATLKSQLRSYDIVVRFGGEEFIVVFTDIAKEQAAQLCNRILAGLIETGVKIAEIEIEYSFTCGVTDIASWDHQPDGIDCLISYADDLLYKGKTNGRKQVVCG